MRLPFILLVAFVCHACKQPDRAGFIGGRTMGTTYSVQIPSASTAVRKEFGAEIHAVLERVNQAMSTYRTDSAISEFNRSRSTEWQTVPASLAAVTHAALVLSQDSGGAFDATVSPLIRLWGFGNAAAKEESTEPPSLTEVSDALHTTSYTKLAVQTAPPALKKQIPELEIDLSAIAKGYAVDLIAELLEQRGYSDYLVEIGGELRTSGKNEQGKAWAIGIESPLAESPLHKLVIDAGGVATSGDYRNFQVKSGQRYSHIIDPRDGYPVAHNLASVTVIHDNAMLADGWSTALMVLGPESGLTLANSHGLAAFFIVRTANGFDTRSSQAFTSDH